MGWADWMVVNQTLEEELELERTVRDVKNCADQGCTEAAVRFIGTDQLASGQAA